MFRVLSDEEADKVKRWKAPTLAGTAANLASAREWASPVAVGDVQTPTETQDELIQAVGVIEAAHTSAPELQVAHSFDSGSNNRASLSNPSVDALQTSYDEGYAKGFADGNAALNQQTIQQLQTVIAAFQQARNEASQDEKLSNEVMGFAMDIARLLIRREVSVDADALSSMIKSGLEQLPSLSSGNPQVWLHPLDAQLLRNSLSDIDTITIIETPALARGQCQIKQDASIVHAGIDDWLAAMERDLGIYHDASNSI